MNNQKADQSQALLNIYDAVSDPSRWELALDTLAEATGCRSAILSVGDVSAQGDGALSDYELSAISQTFRANPEKVAEYFQRFGQQEANEFSFMRDAPRHQILDDNYVWSDIAAMKGRDDFRFRRDHFGIYRRIAVRLDDNPRWAEAALFQLDEVHEEIPTYVREAISLFVPHIAKAVELGRTFVELKRRYSATLSMLDKVKVGLALIGEDGSLLVANEEAKRIIESSSGIHLSSSNKIVLSDGDSSKRLYEAILGATRTAKGINNITEFKTIVNSDSRANTDPELFLEIAPMRDTFRELDSNTGYALLTLIDPNQVESVSTDRLSLAYKLNASETDVCRLLVQGRTQSEVADIRRVTYETVKSQSKQIYRKTGTRSRADLIRLAIRVSPPIES